MNRILLTLLLATLATISFSQNPTAYTDRQTAYIDTALANFSRDAIVLQGLRGIPADSSLQDWIDAVNTSSVADFSIVKLMRYLLLGGTSDTAEILTELRRVPMWLTYADTVRGYWSENHMIQWMSSDWLMHEYYGSPIDATLRDRIIHYLDLKPRYGYYEFFSSTYMPYSLGGILNLADFSKDTVIRDKAELAAQRLLTDLLFKVTDQGVFYPAAGRNYPGKYRNPYGQSHHSMTWMLTGMGEMPKGANHGGVFLATSKLDVSAVINSWKSSVDSVFRIGHSIDSTYTLHDHLPFVDRMMFRWSAGMYFHPMIAEETGILLHDSAFWGHVDFDQLQVFSGFAPNTIASLSEQLSTISKSSLNGEAMISSFRRRGIALHSLYDFWKGKVGYQQYSCVATVGTAAVFIGAGEVVPDWGSRPSEPQNSHQPQVVQDGNVALLMYRPEPINPLFPLQETDLALHWEDAWFDEVRTNGPWLLGRQDDNYVAVRRPCNKTVSGWYACEIDKGQSWVIIVGDEAMYGDFSNFELLVATSSFRESWTADADSTYTASISFAGKNASYSWAGTPATGIPSISELDGIRIYPNPAQDRIFLELQDQLPANSLLRVLDMQGREIKSMDLGSASNNRLQIETTGWSRGMYLLLLESPEGRFHQRILLD